MASQADFDRIGNYARMYNADQNIDRRGQKRIVPMEVLALGMSRTGTLSMHKALSILGYPSPYHFSSIYDNLKDCDYWMELMDAKFEGKGTYSKENFDQLLGHCGAVTDAPCCLFGPELIEYYPDAKVVLVERQVDSWYKSWSSFLDNTSSPILTIFSWLDPSLMGRIAGVGFAITNYQVPPASTLAGTKARSKEAYQKHYAYIRSLVPKENIINFDYSSGWQPLCDFLDKPVPDVPFPHENDTARNQKGLEELGVLAMKRVFKRVTIALTIFVGPAAAWFLTRKI